MAPFIDRSRELDLLRTQYESDAASFVVLYGRRRIGKTTLIREFLRERPGIYFMATEEPERENRLQLTRLLSEATGNRLLRHAQDLPWEDLLALWAAHEPDHRKILVIDEFQYLCSSNPAFASIFQRAWDMTLKDANVMVILCGSLVSMMVAQTLAYGSPLYGRRTAQMRMTQIPFAHYAEFMPERTPDELVQFYAITGGVPRYIEAVRGATTVRDAIRDHILDRRSFLYEEPTFLLEKEVGEVGSYFALIRAIAAGNHKLSAISASLGVPQNRITKYLGTLQAIDLVQRQVPITEENPERSKRGLYFINDHFIAFWFAFVYPYRSWLEMEDVDAVMAKIDEGFIKRHVAYVYECVCMERVWELGKQGVLPRMQRVGRWWNAHEEIDIVGVDDASGTLLLGECKYHSKPIGLNVLYDLRSKANAVAWRKGDRIERYVLFSRSGYDEALRIVAEREGVVLV